ncbi:hypothetical protein [Streptomyces nanshensis]|uniref:Uncharacterized protein n=1 Tax=Streptomyces nanshensis TaxID=518642 RepID=A0A1E7L9Q8_9ACTN|nr:hypothetical protein [Streptomyces nanshensis]OEV12982.1 hypothetical protein AN218_05585 [Streptomyces nanshensis]
MSTPEFQHWQSLTVRRPDDVRTKRGGPVPLTWQMEKHTEHHDRLANNALPADFKFEVERGDAGDALACLALRESMRRDIEHERGGRIREAAELGATWQQVADALDVTPDEARDLLRAWAAGQHHLYRRDVERAQDNPVGLTPEQYAAVLALLDRDDDEAVPARQERGSAPTGGLGL